MTQRTIKVRVYDTNAKKFVNPNEALYINPDTGEIEKTRSGLIVMQFTGRLDKNGKEIYQNDIIKACGNIFLVKWDRQAAAFRYVDSGGNSESPLNYDDVEVSGNVYKN